MMLRRAAGPGILVVTIGVCLVVIPNAARWLVVADPLPSETDAIVVLAGSPPDRALEAARLRETGIGSTVILTRERLRTEVVALRRRGIAYEEAAQVTKRLLLALGVPGDDIRVLRRRAWSTRSEAAVVAEWACRHHVRGLVIVTSPSHTRRARAMFRRALAPGTRITLVPSSAAYFPTERWWRRRHVAKVVLSEYQKLLHFWLWERWWIRPCPRAL